MLSATSLPAIGENSTISPTEVIADTAAFVQFVRAELAIEWTEILSPPTGLTVVLTVLAGDLRDLFRVAIVTRSTAAARTSGTERLGGVSLLRAIHSRRL